MLGNKKGQMAILIALSFGLLFLLFAMVANIGFLVSAKINLQNSVDTAAYAGAAQQARYLSEIAKWNYEMRRNYKAMVYDYMIVMNGEKKHDDFKKYITNPTNATGGKPFACASLQRQSDATSPPEPTLSKLCQNIDVVDFEKVIDKVNLAFDASSASSTAACLSGNTTACLASINLLLTSVAAVDSTMMTTELTGNKMSNYLEQKYNYNRRLLAWMFHDYRHLQSRIRGAHIGNLDIGDYNANTGRWGLIKDNSTVEFENSPIIVASKVLNGYTGIDAPASTEPVLKLEETLLKNPIHNAAYSTFKKNLMTVLYDDSELFHLVPNAPNSNSSPTVASFEGRYLRLKNHDVNFWVTYLSTKGSSGMNTWSVFPTTEPVSNFPVGVAKDARVLTYYTVVGTSSTKNIPFNVFFGDGPGDDKGSENAPMVAIASARPFGSRIGPYINSKCEDLFKGTDKKACIENGLDPLYPFHTDTTEDQIPNFSVNDDDINKKLGVKRTVSRFEYKPRTLPKIWGSPYPNSPNPPLPTDHTQLYEKTTGNMSRHRVYTWNGDMSKDDGFLTPSTPSTDNPKDYYDAEAAPFSRPQHPFGTKNSVIAWNSVTQPQNLDDSKINNYEAYLEKYKGQAVYQLPQVNDRKMKGADYTVYVFRYPDIYAANKKWDIAGLTKKPHSTDKMEDSFANTMAINKFEMWRYVFPYRNTVITPKNIPNNVLNHVTDITNNDSYVFTGVSDTDINPPGEDNLAFTGPTMLKMEGGEALGINAPKDVFAETYTSWRFGTRGYKVKIVNIKDLLTKTSDFENNLSNSYTLPTKNGELTLDLSKIYY